jgi:hypothetical protein
MAFEDCFAKQNLLVTIGKRWERGRGVKITGFDVTIEITE